ncbi:MAG: DnaJ domain-containing protein [Gammaproteobacteria bacterium]|nr:DnaJ domain-containing protein [Gammaproteobacteria bacterium]MCW8987005.1 DnaJ domain-containing protein [Gammaproteobacteria bacterium]MCW9032388.1 DnaJ domain-containing protein [Gammaproteobacteria bacterium]
MQKKKSSIPDEFIQAIQVELENQPAGISEYDLIQNLKSLGYFDFLSSPALPHELFRVHFFLFHALYLLRDIFLNNKDYLLDINTLKIQLTPYSEGESNIQKEDKLRTYYLDFTHLDKTSEDDVYDMLASFWNKVNKFDNREDALAELGLKDPVDDKTIKKEYRRLAMQHHPDRGGDSDKLQKINDALALLLD